jgi:hypothetical protein
VLPSAPVAAIRAGELHCQASTKSKTSDRGKRSLTNLVELPRQARNALLKVPQAGSVRSLLATSFLIGLSGYQPRDGCVTRHGRFSLKRRELRHERSAMPSPTDLCQMSL